MKRGDLILAAAFFLLLASLDFLYVPAPVDSPFPRGTWIAILGHFTLWILSTRELGRRISFGLGGIADSFGLALGLGSIATALLMFILAAIGGLRPELRWGLFAAQAALLGWAPWRKPCLRRTPPLDVAVFLPLGLLFLLPLVDSLVVHSYWDPLHHHLVGARLWWERGRLYFPSEYIGAYQEGGFELLFLWPHFLFARAGGLGLLPVQLFGQLTHCVLGFGGSILLAHAIVRPWLPSLRARAFALTLFAAPASLQFAIPTAKNDWGVALWVLTGFALALGERNRRAELAPGFAWGFALIGKLSAVFVVLPLLTVMLVRVPARWKPLSAGLILGVLPLALRNFVGTGNPFFPLFAGLIPTSPEALGPTWREALAAYQSGVEILPRLSEWRREFPFAITLLALPLFWGLREKPGARALAISLPASLLLFFAAAGPATELRLIGAALPLSGLMVGYVLYRFSASWGPKWERWGVVGMLALSLPLLPFRWDTLARVRSIPVPERMPAAYVSGEAQAWFRRQWKPGEKAALLVDTRVYHSLPAPVFRIWDFPALDAAVRGADSAPGVFRVLREHGFTHLILSQEKLDLFYPADLVGLVERHVLDDEKGVVLRTPFSLVVDLRLAK